MTVKSGKNKLNRHGLLKLFRNHYKGLLFGTPSMTYNTSLGTGGRAKYLFSLKDV